MQDNTPNKILSPWLSLLPITILVGLLALTIYIFGSDALGGGSQVALLMATGICVLIGMGALRKPWAVFEEAMVRNISGVGTAIIILLIIGALSGAWVVSGVVPTLIYYGVQVIHPDLFLLCTCIICAMSPESSSLSVNISSVIESVSFSFTMGMTPSASITSMQCCWFW